MTIAYPLQWPDGWPRAKAVDRKPARFQTTWAKTLDKLGKEVRLLGGSPPIISSNVNLRRDGFPYADMAQDRIPDPGVAVYFTMRNKPRVMARDAHPTMHENLHSLALTIEAMRAIERHGGSLMMERAFEGFASLPAPGSASCWDILQVKPYASREEIEANYRRLARERHPDAGGSDAMMAELNAARVQALKDRT
jgi:hypothetical protein